MNIFKKRADLVYIISYITGSAFLFAKSVLLPFLSPSLYYYSNLRIVDVIIGFLALGHLGLIFGFDQIYAVLVKNKTLEKAINNLKFYTLSISLVLYPIVVYLIGIIYKLSVSNALFLGLFLFIFPGFQSATAFLRFNEQIIKLGQFTFINLSLNSIFSISIVFLELPLKIYIISQFISFLIPTLIFNLKYYSISFREVGLIDSEIVQGGLIIFVSNFMFQFILTTPVNYSNGEYTAVFGLLLTMSTIYVMIPNALEFLQLQRLRRIDVSEQNNSPIVKYYKDRTKLYFIYLIFAILLFEFALEPLIKAFLPDYVPYLNVIYIGLFPISLLPYIYLSNNISLALNKVKEILLLRTITVLAIIVLSLITSQTVLIWSFSTAFLLLVYSILLVKSRIMTISEVIILILHVIIILGYFSLKLT